MPALSMATSVPVPMAMPTEASASAGASLMPSPAMATTRPSRCRRCDHRRASRSGCTSAITSSMPTAARHRLRRRADVARQHHDAQAFGVELPNRVRRRRLDRIVDDHRAGEAGHRRPRRWRSVRRPAARPVARSSAAGVDAVRAQQLRAADEDRVALDAARDARGRQRLKAGHRRPLEAARAGGRDDRGGERMLARLLESGGVPEHVEIGERTRRQSRRSPAAGLRSACRSCRRRACRLSRAARAPRRS